MQILFATLATLATPVVARCVRRVARKIFDFATLATPKFIFTLVNVFENFFLTTHHLLPHLGPRAPRGFENVGNWQFSPRSHMFPWHLGAAESSLVHRTPRPARARTDMEKRSDSASSRAFHVRAAALPRTVRVATPARGAL